MIRGLTVLTMVLAFAGAARAQCVSVDDASLPAPYNPFSTTGINQVVSLSVRRQFSFTNPIDDTNIIFVRRAGDSLPYDIVMVSDDYGSGGSTVLYARPGPSLNIFPSGGELEMVFGSAGSPNVRTAQVRFSLPVKVDLPAGTYEAVFDTKFFCETPQNLVFGSTPSGFRLRLNVLSALQASFVGSALDFGEIGGLSAATVATAPDTVKRRTGNLRVASSGPYAIEVRSQNGWAMTAGGAPTQAATQRIAYQLNLAGRTARAGSEFVLKTCARAGVAGVYLPMAVTLLDGGLGKAANSLYQDVVEVTFTPLGASEAPGATACS